MENWFYVEGTEQRGPVTKDEIINLFNSNKISLETYVWKKGMAQWERYKNVDDLMNDFSDDDLYEDHNIENEELLLDNDATTEVSVETYAEDVEFLDNENFLDELNTNEKKYNFEQIDISEDEFDLDFSWDGVGPDDELFYIKIGLDRQSPDHRIFGPYSISELKEAYASRRINSKTLLIAPGLENWVRVHNSPIHELYMDNGRKLYEDTEKPVMILLNNNNLEFLGIVKNVRFPYFEINVSRLVDELQNSETKTTLFLGNEFKMNRVNVEISNYDHFKQTAYCRIVEDNNDVRSILESSIY